MISYLRKKERIAYENARFQEILRGNKRKSEVRLNLRFWPDVTCVGKANAA